MQHNEYYQKLLPFRKIGCRRGLRRPASSVSARRRHGPVRTRLAATLRLRSGDLAPTAAPPQQAPRLDASDSRPTRHARLSAPSCEPARRRAPRSARLRIQGPRPSEAPAPRVGAARPRPTPPQRASPISRLRSRVVLSPGPQQLRSARERAWPSPRAAEACAPTPLDGWPSRRAPGSSGRVRPRELRGSTRSRGQVPGTARPELEPRRPRPIATS